MQTLINFLAHLNEWFWFSLATILAVLEILIGASFLFVWLALSAMILGVLLLVNAAVTWQVQFLLFATVSLICVLLWKLQRRYQQRKALMSLKSNPAYVANIFTLEEPIVNGRGHLKINDTLWSIQGPDLAVGSKVKVTGIEGMILIIEPA